MWFINYVKTAMQSMLDRRVGNSKYHINEHKNYIRRNINESVITEQNES